MGLLSEGVAAKNENSYSPNYYLTSFQVHAVEFVEPNDRVSNSLRIRNAPNSAADTVGSMAPGERLPLLSKDINYYYEIELNNGQSGFVSKGYSRVVNQPVSSGQLEISLLMLAKATAR